MLLMPFGLATQVAVQGAVQIWHAAYLDTSLGCLGQEH